MILFRSQFALRRSQGCRLVVAQPCSLVGEAQDKSRSRATEQTKEKALTNECLHSGESNHVTEFVFIPERKCLCISFGACNYFTVTDKIA